jgi:hypothetical protein
VPDESVKGGAVALLRGADEFVILGALELPGFQLLGGELGAGSGLGGSFGHGCCRFYCVSHAAGRGDVPQKAKGKGAYTPAKFADDVTFA